MVTLTTRRVLLQEADASLLEWKSHRLKRLCRSTLAAEAAAMDAVADHATFFGFLLSEAMNEKYRATQQDVPRIAVLAVTDCRSLYDTVRKTTASMVTEKRTLVDICAVREAASDVGSVPTQKVPADGLVKRNP